MYQKYGDWLAFVGFPNAATTDLCKWQASNMSNPEDPAFVFEWEDSNDLLPALEALSDLAFFPFGGLAFLAEPLPF